MRLHDVPGAEYYLKQAREHGTGVGFVSVTERKHVVHWLEPWRGRCRIVHRLCLRMILFLLQDATYTTAIGWVESVYHTWDTGCARGTDDDAFETPLCGERGSGEEDQAERARGWCFSFYVRCTKTRPREWAISSIHMSRMASKRPTTIHTSKARIEWTYTN